MSCRKSAASWPKRQRSTGVIEQLDKQQTLIDQASKQIESLREQIAQEQREPRKREDAPVRALKQKLKAVEGERSASPRSASAAGGQQRRSGW